MDELISRQAVLEGLASIAKAKARSDAQKSLMGRVMFFTEHLPSVSTEKPNICEDAISRTDAIRVASGYCHLSNIPKELAKLPSVTPKPCEDAISRQKLKDLGAKCIAKRDENGNLIPLGSIDILPSVSTEKTDSYKKGWHDAIATALKETHSVHTEEGHFRVVQEETLIGVGMAYEQVSTEKTGQMSGAQHLEDIANGKFNEPYTCVSIKIGNETKHICVVNCSSICHNPRCACEKNKDVCPSCGARMEVEE